MENANEKIGLYSIYAESILLEHDYTVSFVTDNDNDGNDNKENVSGTKFYGSFDAVDKWADSITLRAPTGQDRQKNFAREISIHKVKYPFLPEQQIRGKVYKKFGIPAVMGGVMSRSIQCIDGFSSKKRLKNRRKDLKKIEAKKAMALRDIPENNEKLYPNYAKNQPDILETVAERSSVESNFPVICEDPNPPPTNLSYQASNHELPICPKSQTVLEKEILISNSLQIVSPLQLYELSSDSNFPSPPPHKTNHTPETFQIVRSSSAPDHFAIRDLPQSLDLDHRSPNRQIQDNIVCSPSCIYSQQTQILTSHFVLHNPTFEQTQFSIYSCGSEKSTSENKSSAIPGGMNLEDTPTQIIESSPDNKLRFPDVNENYALAAIPERFQAKKLQTNGGARMRIREVTPPTKLFNSGEEAKKMHWSSSIEVSEVLGSRVSAPDTSILDHSYGEMMVMLQLRSKVSKDSKIEKNPSGKFLESEAQPESMNSLKKKFPKLGNSLKRRSEYDKFLKYQNSVDKENIMIRPHSAKQPNHIMFNELPHRDKFPLSSNSASQAKKKRDYYGKNNVTGVKALKETSLFNRRIDILDSTVIDTANRKCSAVNIVSAHLIPLHADVPLFPSVDSISNHCCEYDTDLEKITKICEFVNNFRDDETLKEDLKVEAEKNEIRDRIEDILEFLEHDCRD